MEEYKMVAPVKGGGDSKKLTVEIIPEGHQLCTLYGMFRIGTHDGGQYKDKDKIALMFEFPQEKRVFYEGDDPKPSTSYLETNFSMHEKATLRSLVHGMVGKMTDKEAEEFNIPSLLGKTFVANMEHTVSKKDATVTYSNISSLSKLTDQTRRMFSLAPDQVVERINDIAFFDLAMGFESENFKKIPNFIKDKIKESHEGKAHALSGGVFAESDSNDDSSNNSSTPQKRKLIMLVNDYTYEQYSVDWTDEQLVEKGYAKWDEVSSPPKPQSSSTPPPPMKKPLPPVKKEPVFKLNDPSWDLDDLISQGWTKETLVSEGYASFQ